MQVSAQEQESLLRQADAAPATAGPCEVGDQLVREDADRDFHSPSPEVPPPSAPVAKPCTCGHGKVAHEHYRSGSDCGLCGCHRFRRSFVARLRFR